MKNTKMKQSIAALAMAAVVAVSLLGYGCGSKPAATTGTGATGDFTGTAKGFGGDVTVTLTLTDGKITGCTAEGADETKGVGSKAIEQLPAAIAESGSIAVDGVSTATITSNAIKEAAAAAITAAGLKPEDFQTAVENNAEPAEDSTVDTDIVIVGAGGAGMTAALTATSEGKSVVIVESQPVVGGNSVRATGGMNAGKTVYQDENEFAESAGVEKTLKAAAEKYADNETITALAATVAEQWAAYQANPTGYFDSVELMELDTMIGGKGVNDPALVETLCSNSADAIDWLGEQGITLHSVSSFGGASVKRIHRPVNAEGKTVSVGSYMIPLLEENCEKAGVQMMLNTTATEILTDDNGAAVGIKATGASGETITINAKAVVLTTGGFGANLDMVVEYKPELKGFMTTNAPGILGQGIKMAQTIGAETVVLLSHKKADSYIHIDVEFGEGEGKIPVDSIAKRAEAYKPKEKVTYKMIKEYIEAKYGFKVHTAYIAEVKRNLGLPMYDAPNAVEELKQPRKHPTPEKVEAIKDALRYFAVI